MRHSRRAVSASALDLAFPRLRRIALRNLELAGYPNPSEIADGVFRSLGRVIDSVARFPKLNRDNIHRISATKASTTTLTPKPKAEES